jgi:hypothetical protein
MDKLKQFLEFARKHHFWILCGVSAVVGLVVWYMSTSQLAAQFQADAGKIRQVKSSLEIAGDQPHADWLAGMNAETKKVRQSVWEAWNALYNQQKENVFVWPKDSLKPEFLQAAAKLDADKPTMPVEWRNYYLSIVKNQVQKLAKIVDAAPLDESANTAPGPNGLPVTSDHKVTWQAGSLQEITDSFDWTETPTPLLIKYAQEELWVYSALCKIIAEVNRDATGQHDAPITEITDLQIAYPAAEEAFGGQNDKQRLEEISAPAAGTPTQDSSTSTETASLPRPSIKERGKKSGDTRQLLISGGASSESANDPDFLWKCWRYVDEKKGAPMMATDVDASKDNEYNLMPFHLVLKIDPHYLDRLLVACRNATLPIEVQQVRMGSQISGGTSASGMANGHNALNARYAGSSEHSERSTSSSNASAAPTNVQHERTEAVDIRGVVYLLNPPKAEKLHLNTAGESNNPDEQPAAAPVADDKAATN